MNSCRLCRLILVYILFFSGSALPLPSGSDDDPQPSGPPTSPNPPIGGTYVPGPAQETSAGSDDQWKVGSSSHSADVGGEVGEASGDAPEVPAGTPSMRELLNQPGDLGHVVLPPLGTSAPLPGSASVGQPDALSSPVAEGSILSAVAEGEGEDDDEDLIEVVEVTGNKETPVSVVTVPRPADPVSPPAESTPVQDHTATATTVEPNPPAPVAPDDKVAPAESPEPDPAPPAAPAPVVTPSDTVAPSDPTPAPVVTPSDPVAPADPAPAPDVEPPRAPTPQPALSPVTPTPPTDEVVRSGLVGAPTSVPTPGEESAPVAVPEPVKRPVTPSDPVAPADPSPTVTPTLPTPTDPQPSTSTADQSESTPGHSRWPFSGAEDDDEFEVVEKYMSEGDDPEVRSLDPNVDIEVEDSEVGDSEVGDSEVGEDYEEYELSDDALSVDGAEEGVEVADKDVESVDIKLPLDSVKTEGDKDKIASPKGDGDSEPPVEEKKETADATDSSDKSSDSSDNNTDTTGTSSSSDSSGEDGGDWKESVNKFVKSRAGMITFITLGSTLGVLLLIGFLVFCLRRRRPRHEDAGPNF